jgi:hypothetical protein
MEVIATLDLGPEDREELARILRCDEDELGQHLADYACAALTEYTQMFLGKRVFRRGTDHSEYRLLLLIQGPFGGRVPDEQEVSRLFQTTATESRALIRSVISKYQYLLRDAIDASLRALVETAAQDHDGGPFTVMIRSQNMVDELNRLLAEIDGSLPPVRKKRGGVTTYEIEPSSRARLVARLRLEEAEDG